MNNQDMDYKINHEIKRLEALYPLFHFKVVGNLIAVEVSNSSIHHTRLNNSTIGYEAQARLDRLHLRKSMSQFLMSLYPDLYISIFPSRYEMTATAWVNRDGKDAEAIGSVNLLSPKLHTVLANWQDEAQKSKQEDWFFCTGHQRAEPKSEYGYFHFAGNYCKSWGDAHPAERRAAEAESYE